MSNSVYDGPNSLYSGSFWTIFFILMISMVGLFTMLDLQMLYTVQHMAFSDRQATLLLTTSISLMFTMPIIGGYLASRWLTPLVTISFGFVFAIAGLYTICLADSGYFYSGLASFILGNGCIMANTLGLLSRLFPKNDARRDRAFLVCFIGMNIGAFIATTGLTLVAVNLGYHFAFLTCACLFVIALFLFVSFNFQLKPLLPTYKAPKITSTTLLTCSISLSVALLVSSEILHYSKDHLTILYLLGSVGCVFVGYTATKLVQISYRTLLIALFLLVTSITFWAFYMLAPSLVTLYIERTQHHTLFNYTVPSSCFYALNPLFVILSGTGYATILRWRQRKVTNTITWSAVPFLLALGCMSLAYLILSIVYDAPLYSLLQIVAYYALLSFAEVLIFPLGASVISRLLPSGREGLLTGIWLLSISLGGLVSGMIAKLTVYTTDTNTAHTIGINYPLHFLHFALVLALITGGLTFLYYVVQRQPTTAISLN